MKILRQVRQAGRAGGQQGRRPARRGRGVRRCGTSGWASRCPVSALHGRGSGDMLDAILAALPEPPPESYGEVGGPRRVAIVGRPERRQVLAAEQARQGGPGGRRRRRRHHGRPGRRAGRARRAHLAVHRHRRHPQADQGGVRARVLRDACAPTPRSSAPRCAWWSSTAPQPISEQDLRIITAVAEAGRALVIAFNKWDLVDEERRYYLDREVERDLVRVQWAPRINITARTGWHVDRLVPALDAALEGWSTRVGTGAAQRLPRAARRRAPAPGPRRQAAEDPVRHPGRRPSRRRSCCSPARCSRRRTCASSSAGCARSSASSAARCTCSSARARSASAADPAAAGYSTAPVARVTVAVWDEPWTSIQVIVTESPGERAAIAAAEPGRGRHLGDVDRGDPVTGADAGPGGRGAG